jgi:plasmid stabilization system protein ParE
MSYTVVFAPQAEDQLAELYGYIAARASPATAERYTDAHRVTLRRLERVPAPRYAA